MAVMIRPLALALVLTLCSAWTCRAQEAVEAADAQFRLSMEATEDGMKATVQFPGGIARVERTGGKITLDVIGSDRKQGYDTARLLLEIYHDLMTVKRLAEPSTGRNRATALSQLERARDRAEVHRREADELWEDLNARDREIARLRLALAEKEAETGAPDTGEGESVRPAFGIRARLSQE